MSEGKGGSEGRSEGGSEGGSVGEGKTEGTGCGRHLLEGFGEWRRVGACDLGKEAEDLLRVRARVRVRAKAKNNCWASVDFLPAWCFRSCPTPTRPT